MADKASVEQGLGPQTTCRKWKAEIHRALKQQKKWQEEAEEVMKIYRNEADGAKRKPLFNILAANTDTIRPAVYNSTPKADIRRRFRKADPVGRAISEILQNVIEYENDTTEFDEAMQLIILDTLLPGRGVAIVEYEPKIEQQLDEEGNPIPMYEEMEEYEEEERMEDENGDAYKPEPKPLLDELGNQLFEERLVAETTPVRHIQYCDFIHGQGQEWHEVDWIGIRYRMTKKECKKMFPETYTRIRNYSQADDEYLSDDKDMNKKLATAEIWKIWDKVKRKIIFINDSCTVPLKEEEDPLNLEGFFPCPKPLVFKKDQTSLNPIPPYRMYKEQAEELQRVIAKRNGIISAMKVRGVYDGSLGDDITKMLNSENLELTPIRNRQQIEAAGGIGNAIWIMPLNELAQTLRELYQAEEELKSTIYEITGIADIMRGASMASETATAQRIKSQWGSLRVQDLQRDVQRYAKDLFKIKAEIMAEHYDPQTLQTISAVEVDPQLIPEILFTLKNDKLRSYKIDIETNSTIQETIDSDMSGLQEAIGGIAQIYESLGPIVQQGAMQVEQIEALVQGFVRKARLGRDVEEAFAQASKQTAQQQSPEVLQQAEQYKSAADQVLDAAKVINEQNQQQIAQIAQGKAAYEKMVIESKDYAATATMLQQLLNDMQNSKNVDSQAIRALRAIQASHANTSQALTEQLGELQEAVLQPKVVSFNRDDKGKINAAVAQPAPPKKNGGE